MPGEASSACGKPHKPVFKGSKKKNLREKFIIRNFPCI